MIDYFRASKKRGILPVGEPRRVRGAGEVVPIADFALRSLAPLSVEPLKHILYKSDKSRRELNYKDMSLTLGAFEELILLAVCGLRESAYAVTIQRRIEEEGGRGSSMGAVYATLDRLERKGLVRSQLGPVTNAPGGRKKRFYQVTGAGVAGLSAVNLTRKGLWTKIDEEFLPRLGYGQ